MPETNKTLAESFENTILLLSGHATDQTWAMLDTDGLIGLRLDSGDAGVMLLDKASSENCGWGSSEDVFSGMNEAGKTIIFIWSWSAPSLFPGATSPRS